MKKYVVLGLVLIVVSLGEAPAAAPQRLPASAWAVFGVSSAGVRTSVKLGVNGTASGVLISLFIFQNMRRCGPDGDCREQPLISGFTLQQATPTDAAADRILGRAYVHATVRFHDDISQTDLPVRVDVIWSRARPQVCEPGMVIGLGTTLECARTARVLADVAIGRTSLIRNQTVPDGELRWELRDA